MPDYDAILVGAGNNGLMVAAYMAKAGLKLLVLEARDFVGGGVVTQEITAPGFKHDVGATAAGWLDMNPIIRNDELGMVKRSGIKFLPPPEVQEVQIFPDDRALIMYRDIDKTCASIAQFSQKDADSFRKLYDMALPLLEPVLRGSNMPPPPFGNYLTMMSASPTGIELMRTTLGNGVDFINDWFEDDHVKIMMTRWSATTRMSPYESGTAGAVLFQVPWTMKYGMKPIEGGAGKFTDALADAIKAFGGEIRTKANVKQITVENNRATGVVLENGEKIAAAKCVITSVNVKELFPGMTPDAQLPAGFADWIQRLKPQRVQYYTTHYALNNSPKYKVGGDVDRGYQVHITTATKWYDYLDSIIKMHRGNPRTTGPGILCNTLFDPTRAPAGKHTLWVNSQQPYYLKGGPQRWDGLKDEVTAGLLKTIQDRTTNMGPENIIASKTFTPLDFARWNPAWIEGDPSHIGGYLYQYMSNRPMPGWGGYKSPVDKLFLCGPSTHPGTGLNAGARAPANVILKELGIEFDKVI